MRIHADDRGFRYCDVFPEIGIGDINITVLYPDELTAWHRHQHQTDYMLVIKGALKIGVCNGSKNCYMNVEDGIVKSILRFYHQKPPEGWKPCTCNFHYLSERNVMQGPLKIESGLWHGTYNFTTEPAILIYHITQKYNSKDEERATVQEMGWDWKREVK